MGTSDSLYTGETLIVEFGTEDTDTGPTTTTLVEREARHNGLDIVNIRTEVDAENDVEILTIALDDAEENADAVASFQRALTTYFRFETFRQVAVEPATVGRSND